MTITIDMLPKLFSTLTGEPPAVDLTDIDFVGGAQYGLGVLFTDALKGELPFQPGHEPIIGDPQIGPHHIMDSMARDYALLPAELTASTKPLNVCCVRDALPTCDECGDHARYDIWATSHMSPAMRCQACTQPYEGFELGRGSATYILTLDEMPWTIRDICNSVMAELGRASLWQ